MAKFYETLLDLLKTKKKFLSEDGKELLLNAVYEAAMKMDADLVEMLLGNPETKKRFFTEVKGTEVFDKMGFAWLISNKRLLPDSYTRFSSQLGLADADGNFLRASGKVQLVFPFKDCVLEGGQTKEDQKFDEIFYNETLAFEEIDRLRAPKVFTGATRYTEGGKAKATSFDRDDNLVIKGNNLLAIYSLLENYRGKIKLIYIDPPYNTGSDSFNYNDNLSRETWLTFMKNRLEVAQDLLSEDGSIYVQLDFNQVHYAKVLMDEIFGPENFQREIIWRMGHLSGFKTSAKNYIRNHDTILFYSKNSASLYFNKEKSYILNKDFKPILKDTKELRRYLKNEQGLSDYRITEILNYINHESRGEHYPLEDTWNCSQWDALDSLAIRNSTSRDPETVLLPNGENFKGQKDEKLLKRMIDVSTEENDIVLDFFGGLGSTAATAHKMGRRYILVEQMDLQMEAAVGRLQSVISGENKGISKEVGWQGGGSFVYCELAKLNQKFIEEIMATSDDDGLQKIYNRIIESGFISRKIDPRKIQIAAKEYSDMPLSDKKKFLMATLDANFLYVNYCDMNDAEFEISADDKAFTDSFYRKGE